MKETLWYEIRENNTERTLIDNGYFEVDITAMTIEDIKQACAEYAYNTDKIINNEPEDDEYFGFDDYGITSASDLRTDNFVFDFKRTIMRYSKKSDMFVPIGFYTLNK